MKEVLRRRPSGRLLSVSLAVTVSLFCAWILPAFEVSVPAHNQAGKKALAARDWKAAANEYGESLRLDPSQPDTQISLGIALWGSGDRDGAAKAFQKAVELEPGSARAHLNVAVAYRDLGQPDKALSEIRT